MNACALDKEPNYRRAKTVQEQLDAPDPMSYGQRKRGSGSHRYTVKSGDTLGGIARRCFGNTDFFVTLARVNQQTLRSPSALSAGDVLTVPGAKSCEAAPPPPPQPAPPSQSLSCGDIEEEKAKIYAIAECSARRDSWLRLGQCYPDDLETQINISDDCG
ncbi:MAG: LysM peptidoglycan-binding domain-containing protein [Gammaproteobacteria bacterium]|nr:LysM peptidoglycan-binding domain-containing protein [Gammaproteobacteria bacterium]